MDEKQKKPEIRFKGFTNAWEQRKLGEISDKVTKKNKNTIVEEVFTNSAEFGIISQRDFFDKDIANSENIDGYYIVKPNDFVYNPRISTTAPFGPIKRNKLERAGAMSPLYYVFKSHDINLDYLEWFFQTTCWHAFMRFNGNSGARSDRFAISDKIFKELPISIPKNNNEQKNIGTLLTELDLFITLHQRKCNQLETFKKSMLEKMFPENGENVPKVRFKGFTDAWEQLNLNNLMADFIVPMRDKPKEFSGTIPWTRIEDIEGKYLNDSLSGQYVSEETVKKMNLKIIPQNSLIVSSSATFGVVAIVTKDLITNQTFIGMVPNDKETIDYWYAYFHSKEAKKYMNLQSVGSTIFYIARDKFEKMPVKVPKKEEMLKLGKFFSDIDTRITLYQRKVEKLENIKKSLLDKMFV